MPLPTRLPLHRQMQRFDRAGVKLAYSTLTDWVSATCKLINPLYEALKAEILQSGYIHADETVCLEKALVPFAVRLMVEGPP